MVKFGKISIKIGTSSLKVGKNWWKVIEVSGRW